MKKYILLAAVVISLTACNNEDNYIDEPVAAQISATIGGSDLSRARDVSWDNGDNIGISMNGRYLNLQYTTENGDGVFAGTPMFFNNKVDPVTLTAYYPYTGAEGESPAIIEATTDAGRQTADEQSKFDFLYDKQENVTGAQPNVNFTFKHMMSKLTLNFINGNKGTDVSKITSCEIGGLILEGTFDPVSGVCSANTDTPSSVLNLTPTVTNGNVSLSLILFPQNTGNVTMRITDSENQKYSCDLNFKNNCLESGNNYQFTIKVKKTELSVVGGITNWNTESSEGKAESAD